MCRSLRVCQYTYTFMYVSVCVHVYVRVCVCMCVSTLKLRRMMFVYVFGVVSVSLSTLVKPSNLSFTVSVLSKVLLLQDLLFPSPFFLNLNH